jgi:putative endonuclease
MYCYILYSSAINQYYVGITTDSVEQRLFKHNESYYGQKFTSKTSDWTIYLVISCQCNRQMIEIEKHIKRMKSRIYIENLKKYPDIIERLKIKYSCT